MTHSRVLVGFLSVMFGVAMFALLQGAVSLGLVSQYIVPSPSDMLFAIPELFVEEGLVEKFILTFSTTFGATLLAVVIGVPFGWFLHARPAFGRAYESWLGTAFSAPLILLYPLFMVIFGRGTQTLIVMGTIAGVIPIVLGTLQGLRGVPKVYINVARSLKMTEWQTATKVLLPAAIPTIFTGIRLGLIYTLIYVVAIEFLVSIGGLGYLISDLHSRYDIPGMYGAVIFVVLVSVLFFAATERVERWLKST